MLKLPFVWMTEEELKNWENIFFKVMNNSVFGKTMENVRNRIDIRLKTSAEQCEWMVKKTNYKKTTIFTENLAAVHMSRTEVELKKPIYLGMCILDTSKTLMYD
jgi:hypothetical protein